MGLWCGNEHIIMATRIPAPQSVTGYQEASLGSKAFSSTTKIQLLSRKSLRHLPVCISSSQGCHTALHTSISTSLVDIFVKIPLYYIYATIPD